LAGTALATASLAQQHALYVLPWQHAHIIALQISHGDTHTSTSSCFICHGMAACTHRSATGVRSPVLVKQSHAVLEAQEASGVGGHCSCHGGAKPFVDRPDPLTGHQLAKNLHESDGYTRIREYENHNQLSCGTTASVQKKIVILVFDSHVSSRVKREKCHGFDYEHILFQERQHDKKHKTAN
jgi:hypothetical protein